MLRHLYQGVFLLYHNNSTAESMIYTIPKLYILITHCIDNLNIVVYNEVNEGRVKLESYNKWENYHRK